jgi:TolB-like protein
MSSRCFALLAIGALLGTSLAGAQGDTRPGIAVLPITNGGSYGQAKEDFDALEKGLAGMLISELSANPAARVVERERLQQLLDEQTLGAGGRVDDRTAARVGDRVGARYIVKGTFQDFYGDFRLDLHIVNVATGEIVKTVTERARRDHLFDAIKNASQRLMREAGLPPLPPGTQQQRMGRQFPAEALMFYAKALLYQDRGERARAVEMYQLAIEVFPDFAEAREALRRGGRS